MHTRKNIIRVLVEHFYGGWGGRRSSYSRPADDGITYTMQGDPVDAIAGALAKAASDDLIKASSRSSYKDYPRVISLSGDKLCPRTARNNILIGAYDPEKGKYPEEYRYMQVRTTSERKTKDELVDLLKGLNVRYNFQKKDKGLGTGVMVDGEVANDYIIKDKFDERFDVKLPFKVALQKDTAVFMGHTIANDFNVKTWNEKFGSNVDNLKAYIKDNLETSKARGDGTTYGELLRKYATYPGVQYTIKAGVWSDWLKRKQTSCSISGDVPNPELGPFVQRVNVRADEPQVVQAAQQQYEKVKGEYEKYKEAQDAERAYKEAHSSKYLNFGTNSSGGIANDFYAMARADNFTGQREYSTGRCMSETVNEKYRFKSSVDSSD